jgi:hypothetical protein
MTSSCDADVLVMRGCSVAGEEGVHEAEHWSGRLQPAIWRPQQEERHCARALCPRQQRPHPPHPQAGDTSVFSFLRYAIADAKMSARSVVAAAATQDRGEHDVGPPRSTASARALNSKGTGTGWAVLQMCALNMNRRHRE